MVKIWTTHWVASPKVWSLDCSNKLSFHLANQILNSFINGDYTQYQHDRWQRPGLLSIKLRFIWDDQIIFSQNWVIVTNGGRNSMKGQKQWGMDLKCCFRRALPLICILRPDYSYLIGRATKDTCFILD